MSVPRYAFVPDAADATDNAATAASRGATQSSSIEQSPPPRSQGYNQSFILENTQYTKSVGTNLR